MCRGKLLVISGPSGAGKGTVCKRLLEDLDNLRFSVSMTTRSPRKGEVEGKNYYFVSREEFEKGIKSDSFLEYARVFDNYYGTPKEMVMQALNDGIDVVLEIDTQGALQVKERFEEAILIFILPPSMKELRNRIVNRATEDEDKIAKRLGEAIGEIRSSTEYDYIVLNDDLEIALNHVKSIITAEHLKLTDDKAIEKIIKNFEEEI